MSTVETSPTFIDDDSWAQPRKTATRGWKTLAVILGLCTVALTVFGVGVRFGKARVGATSTDLFSGRGGFPGAGAGGGRPTSDQLSQIFGQPSQGVAAVTAGESGSGAPKPALEARQGKITAVDGSSVTIERSDGTSVLITLTPDTPIGRRSSVDAKALVVGTFVEVTSSGDPAKATEILTGDLVTIANSTGSVETTTTIDAGLGGLLPSG
jgi:hypothetical protein